MTKISKSKLNVVDPDIMFDRFGTDTVRLYMLSDAPPDKDQIWSASGINGSWRMLNRLWSMIIENIDTMAPIGTALPDSLDDENKALRRKANQVILRVTEAIEGGFQFNTALARCNELLNQFRSTKGDVDPAVLREVFETVVCVMSPIVPHFSEELWNRMGHAESIFEAGWPEADEEIAREEELEIPIQVNGKLKARIKVPAGISNDDLEKAAMDNPDLQKNIEGKTIRKVIVVPGKLVNIAVS